MQTNTAATTDCSYECLPRHIDEGSGFAQETTPAQAEFWTVYRVYRPGIRQPLFDCRRQTDGVLAIACLTNGL